MSEDKLIGAAEFAVYLRKRPMLLNKLYDLLEDRVAKPRDISDTFGRMLNTAIEDAGVPYSASIMSDAYKLLTYGSAAFSLTAEKRQKIEKTLADKQDSRRERALTYA